MQIRPGALAVANQDCAMLLGVQCKEISPITLRVALGAIDKTPGRTMNSGRSQSKVVAVNHHVRVPVSRRAK